MIYYEGSAHFANCWADVGVMGDRVGCLDVTHAAGEVVVLYIEVGKPEEGQVWMGHQRFCFNTEVTFLDLSK